MTKSISLWDECDIYSELSVSSPRGWCYSNSNKWEQLTNTHCCNKQLKPIVLPLRVLNNDVFSEANSAAERLLSTGYITSMLMTMEHSCS